MRPVCLFSSLFAVALVAGPAISDEPAPGRSPAPGGVVREGAAPGRSDAVPRAERARQLVRELEDALARAKAAQPVDAQLLAKLLDALEQARALAKPVRLADLAPDERKALEDEVRRSMPQSEERGPGGGDWAERMYARALEGAELGEEEAVKAKKIIGDWFTESRGAWGDSKKQSDLKRQRDDDLEKALGRKKAQKVINNLNSIGPRGR